MENRKILKNRIGWYTIGIVVALITVGVGIFMIAGAFNEADQKLQEEHNAHLLDIAWATDRNIAALLDRPKDELGIAVEQLRATEADYIADGDAEAFLEYLRKLPILRTDYVSMLLTVKDEQPLFCTDCGTDCEFSFPFGFTTEKPCLCVGEGKSYLALAEKSPDTDLYYAALIDLNTFYGKLVGKDLTDEYWLLLYDDNTGLFLQNDRDQPETVRHTREEALAREDGYSLMVESEIRNQIITERYDFVIENRAERSEILMSVIPTSASVNGMFAVGVAVESGYTSELLRGIARNVLYSGVLIALGLVIFLAILKGNHEHNKELREQTELLKEQNNNMQHLLDTTQELAHHQRLEIIGTMTSSIAHEFNNMLTPIMGYSIMVMENLPEGCDELYENLSEIYDASRRAKSLVSRLSALSRKGNASEAKLFSPDSLLGKVEEMAMPAKPKTVEVLRDYHCPEVCLLANETQIGQLLLNLVINAFQAMEADGGSLTLFSRRENGFVEFRVSDTGPGIAPELLPKIFDPFFTTKEMGRGTGLGLAIAQQIVSEHKGTIRVISKPGEGTTFFISLPENQEKPEK